MRASILILHDHAAEVNASLTFLCYFIPAMVLCAFESKWKMRICFGIQETSKKGSQYDILEKGNMEKLLPLKKLSSFGHSSYMCKPVFCTISAVIVYLTGRD